MFNHVTNYALNLNFVLAESFTMHRSEALVSSWARDIVNRSSGDFTIASRRNDRISRKWLNDYKGQCKPEKKE